MRNSQLINLDRTPGQRRQPGERPVDRSRGGDSTHFRRGETFIEQWNGSQMMGTPASRARRGLVFETRVDRKI